MKTRSDIIFEILRNSETKRMRVSEIRSYLAKFEGVSPSDISDSLIPATIRMDNQTRERQGRKKRFNCFSETYAGNEEKGYISLLEDDPECKDLVIYQICRLIEKANYQIKELLKNKIKQMDWQFFESQYLNLSLQHFGFHDSYFLCDSWSNREDRVFTYSKGLVQCSGILSTQCWNDTTRALEEVQRLRGIKGNFDTGVLFTTSSFSEDACHEAKPAQNTRSIVLIDGDLLTKVIWNYEIGIKRVNVPILYELDDGEVFK